MKSTSNPQRMTAANTLLHMACAFGHVDHVHYLIQRGADLNRLNNTGDSVLMAACQDKCLKKVKYLVDIGCDVNHCDLHRANIYGMTALHFAAGFSTVAVVKYLLCNENYFVYSRFNWRPTASSL